MEKKPKKKEKAELEVGYFSEDALRHAGVIKDDKESKEQSDDFVYVFRDRTAKNKELQKKDNANGKETK